MHVIITCKCEKDRMKNNREKVATLILEAQGQVICGPGSDLAEFQAHPSSCMSSLSARMKRIQSKTAEKKWQHRFPHSKYMEKNSDAKGQLTPQSVVESRPISNSSELSCMSSLPVSMKKIG